MMFYAIDTDTHPKEAHIRAFPTKKARDNWIGDEQKRQPITTRSGLITPRRRIFLRCKGNWCSIPWIDYLNAKGTHGEVR